MKSFRTRGDRGTLAIALHSFPTSLFRHASPRTPHHFDVLLGRGLWPRRTPSSRPLTWDFAGGQPLAADEGAGEGVDEGVPRPDGSVDDAPTSAA